MPCLWAGNMMCTSQAKSVGKTLFCVEDRKARPEHFSGKTPCLWILTHRKQRHFTVLGTYSLTCRGWQWTSVMGGLSEQGMWKHLRSRWGRYIFLRTTNAPLLAGTLLSFLIFVLQIKIKIIHDLKKHWASVHSLDPIKLPWVDETRFKPRLPLTPHSFAILLKEHNHRTDWFAGWWDRARDGFQLKMC